MWILPKNLQLTDPSTSSAFVADTVASKEDLTLLAPTIESSLMWRSKASPLRTWSTRWNRVSWMPHLFTRILKPSQHTSFEAALTSSLADIRASRLVQREDARGKMTPDISGPTSDGTLTQLNLFNASSRTSRDTSRLDSPQFSATWKKMVTTQRGEYSQRLKSAHLTRESACSFWPTPVAQDDNKSPEAHMKMKANMKGGPRYKPTSLQVMVKGVEKGLWPTPRTTDTNQGRGVVEINGKLYRPSKALSQGILIGGANLSDAVQMWPTPSAHEARLGYQDRSDPTKKGTQESLTTVIVNRAGGRTECTGHLNPAWVEWLMGVPTGWTELGCWETE